MTVCIEDIQVTTGKHCIFATMQQALGHSGSNLSEAALFFLCGGMNIPYLGNPKTFWFNRMGQLTDPFVQIQSQFTFSNTSQDNPVHLVNDCTESLEQGYPVLLLVRSQCLNYHRAYIENETRGHVVLLYGLDAESNVAHITDSYLLDNSGRIHTYQGTVALDKLEAGCISVTSYRPLSENRQTPKEIVLSAYVDHLATYVDPDKAPDTGGLNAVRHVISHLAELVDMSGKELQRSCQEVYYGMRVGGILHHIEYIQTYAEEAGLVLRNGYREAISLLETLYKEWKTYLLLLYKSGVQGRSSRMPELGTKGLRLLNTYEEALQGYIHWLKNQVES